MADKADNDDEITVDFSKLTSFFKGGQKRPKEETSSAKPKPSENSEKTPSTEGNDESEDISVDLGKIGSFFKSKAGSKPEHDDTAGRREKSEDKEISIDFRKIKHFFTHIHPSILVLILVLIPLILGVYIRFQTDDLHLTDTWARNTVYNYYQNAISDQIDQQYPTLPAAKKSELLSTQFSQFLKEQSSMIEPQITQLSGQFKQEFKDGDGNNYLPDIDTYYWLRFIDNLDKKGHIGDEVINNSQFDNHYQYPEGRFISKGEYFHIYLGYYFYKALKIFDSSIVPMVAFAYLPVFLFGLCSIFIFFITKRIAGNAGGFFAALLLAVVPFFVTKSAVGYADTDIEVVFFPLLITFLFLEAFESKRLWKDLIFGVLAGLATGLFSYTWMGWWYIFDFIIGAAGLYLIYFLIINRNRLSEQNTRKSALWLLLPVLIFVVSTAISSELFAGSGTILNAVRGPLSFINIKSVATETIWPNVYTTVAEQNEVPLSNLIDDIGGMFLFVLSIIGIAMTLTKKDKHGNIDLKYALLLSIWFLSTLYASTKGLRFILIIVPAFSVGFGVFAGLTIRHVSRFLEKEISIPKSVGTAVIALILMLILLPSGLNAYNITVSTIPDISDAWVRSLEEIKSNATEPAVINSWWDFGHWFKYWADTPVTFDGTSQQTPRAHWIGWTLLTEDEDEAIAMLRLLDCGADYTALGIIDDSLNDTMESVYLLKKEILLDRDEAVKLLTTSGFGKDKAEEIVALTHCEPPENYLITSGDMVQKSGVWAHFGSWNFTKADMVLNVKPLSAADGKKLLSERYGISQAQLDKYYYDIETQDANNWISGWPSFASSLSSCTNSSDLIICSDGLKFNLSSGEMYGDTSSGRLYPSRYSYIDEDGKFRIESRNTSLITSNSGQPLGAALIKSGGSYTTLMMSPELVGSMFTRLYYFNGQGLKHFDYFYYDRDVRGTEIYVWKVDWEGR